MKTTRAERICAVLLFSVLFIGTLIFFGQPVLVMFDVITYDPVMSQPVDQVVHVELLDYVEGEYIIAADLTGQTLSAFMEEYLSLKFRRYFPHPTDRQGERVIKIYYADGGYDLAGLLIELYDSDGNWVRVRGWYYIDNDDMSFLFDKFAYSAVESIK